MTHLVVELPIVTTLEVAEFEDAFCLPTEKVKRLLAAIERAEQSIGHDHPPLVHEALELAAALFDAHVEPIIDRERWVAPAFSPHIAIFVDRGSGDAPTIIYDTSDDAFYLASRDEWVAAHDETLFQEELEWTTVYLDSLGNDDGMVNIYLRHPRACDLAMHHQSIAGAAWECVDDDLAYAIVDNHHDLVAEIESEGYDANLDEYDPP